MFSTSAAHLVSVWPNLFELGLGFDMTDEHAVAPEEYRETIRLMAEVCDGVGWKDLGRQAKRLLVRAEAGERGESMMKLAEDLRHAFQEKSGDVHIIVIEERDTDLFKGAAEYLCGRKLHPALSVPEEEF